MWSARRSGGPVITLWPTLLMTAHARDAAEIRSRATHVAEAISVPLRPMVKQLTLTVRISGSREFAARCWIAARLATVMAWVVGTKLDMSIDLMGDEDAGGRVKSPQTIA